MVVAQGQQGVELVMSSDRHELVSKVRQVMQAAMAESYLLSV